MLSVIIAAFNEEKRLPDTLRKISAFLMQRKMDHEIIVVDDGSNDATSSVSEQIALQTSNISVIRYERTRGKGFALRTGVLASKGDFVLVSDADLSTPIEELSTLLPLLEQKKCQVAIGSRALAMSNIIKKQPWWRQGMGRIFNRFVRFIVLDAFRDTQCGFKLFEGNIARSIFREARIDRFAYDVEVLAMAIAKGCKVLEVPIRWINAPGSKVNPLWDSLQMLKDLIRIRINVGFVQQDVPLVIGRPRPHHIFASFKTCHFRVVNRLPHRMLRHSS